MRRRKGSWQGIYGRDGYNVIANAVSYPSYATVIPSGHTQFIWAPSTTDVRGLQKPGGADRIGAAWYGDRFTVDVKITDGVSHTISIYVMDWDGLGRRQTLEVRDAVTNALLDTRAVSGFQGGQYWRWTIAGHVVLRVVNTGSPNAVISGIFFDPTSTSTAASVTVGSATTSAEFVATDTTKRDSWLGVYGSGGFNAINDTTNHPSHATVTPTVFDNGCARASEGPTSPIELRRRGTGVRSRST